MNPPQPCRITLDASGDLRFNGATRVVIFNPGGSQFFAELSAASVASGFEISLVVSDPTTPFPGAPEFPATQFGAVRILGPVPEPSSWAMIGVCGLLVGWAYRRKLRAG